MICLPNQQVRLVQLQYLSNRNKGNFLINVGFDLEYLSIKESYEFEQIDEIMTILSTKRLIRNLEKLIESEIEDISLERWFLKKCIAERDLTRALVYYGEESEGEIDVREDIEHENKVRQYKVFQIYDKFVENLKGKE